MKKKVEILSPAGNFECLSAAVRAGADSVYFGVGKLNMRARAASNFEVTDFRKISRICRTSGVESYLALNSLLYDDDIPEMRMLCDEAKGAGISAVIVSDMAAAVYANSIGMPVHISVQANISNFESLLFFAKFADVAVLARELNLGQIREIARKVADQDVRGASGKPLRIEVFAHGALCVAISGKCNMSLAAYNSSANRGDCYQNCRRSYRVIDDETGYEMKIDNRYVMSPKDLSTIRILDRIIASGVSILKIEGRGRSADYVAAVTAAYRKALDMCLKGESSAPEKLSEIEKELETVFNRGFWNGGYYLGDKAGEWSGISGSRASLKKSAVGFVSNYYARIGVAEVTINAESLCKGDKILITGPTTGALVVTPEKLAVDDVERDVVSKGEVVTFKIDRKLRRSDKVYSLTSESTGGLR